MRRAAPSAGWIRIVTALFALAVAGCSGRIAEGLPWGVDAGDAGPVTSADGGMIALDPFPTGRARDAGSGSRSDGRARDDQAPDAGRAETPRGSASGRDYAANSAAFFGASRCSQLGALLCDDFESESPGSRPDPMVWTAPYGYLPQVDTTRAARGEKSLHFRLGAATPGHIEETVTFPALSGSLFGRMFVWFDALPSSPSSAQWSVMSATTQDEQSEVRLGGLLLNENRFGLGSRRAGEGGGEWHTVGTDAQARPKTGAWTCLEWQLDGRSNQTRVWIDGVEQGSLHLTETDFRPGDAEQGQRFVQPTYARLRIGWWLYPAENPQPGEYSVWIDEVAVDGERIGCVN